MKKLFTPVFMILLVISVKNAHGQSDSARDSVQELELARTLLSDMQDSLDSMDPRLLEPLEQLADSLIQLHQFDEAHNYLDRAIQIARVEGGLYAESQRPLLVKKIENYTYLDDWDSAREDLEHLSWLYTTKSRRIDENLVEDLVDLSRMHLRALVEDDSYFQGYHLRQSTRMRGIALAVAERIWSRTDERLAPMIYDQLRQLHMQTSALWHGGPASLELRQFAPGVGTRRSRFDVNKDHYLAGLRLLNELYGIYSAEEPQNLEGLAMVTVYRADWHVLYDKLGIAEDTYRLAYDRLVKSGVEASLLDELFSQPMIIPDTKFHTTVRDAVVAKQNQIVTLGDTNSQDYLTFNEWSSSLPNVRSPIDESEKYVDSNYALFSFSLAGINKVSRWDAHRFASSVSTIEKAQLLGHFIEPSPAEPSLLEKLNHLTFRPKLVGGEPQQTEGLLMYQIADQ